MLEDLFIITCAECCGGAPLTLLLFRPVVLNLAHCLTDHWEGRWLWSKSNPAEEPLFFFLTAQSAYSIDWTSVIGQAEACRRLLDCLQIALNCFFLSVDKGEDAWFDLLKSLYNCYG